MYHRVIGLDESSTEYEMKKAYCKLGCRFHPDKNKHSQFSDIMKKINDSKEELEDTLRHNDVMREQECVRMAQNYIEISSDSSSSSSSDDSLETSPDDSSHSVTRQIPTKSVM